MPAKHGLFLPLTMPISEIVAVADIYIYSIYSSVVHIPHARPTDVCVWVGVTSDVVQ